MFKSIKQGYETGKELIQLIKKIKSININLENIVGTKYESEFNKISEKIEIINNKGSYCQKFGMKFLAVNLNASDYYDGLYIYKLMYKSNEKFSKILF